MPLLQTSPPSTTTKKGTFNYTTHTHIQDIMGRCKIIHKTHTTRKKPVCFAPCLLFPRKSCIWTQINLFYWTFYATCYIGLLVMVVIQDIWLLLALGLLTKYSLVRKWAKMKLVRGSEFEWLAFPPIRVITTLWNGWTPLYMRIFIAPKKSLVARS